MPNFAKNMLSWAYIGLLILCPVGWLVNGSGARAVSRKAPIYFILIPQWTVSSVYWLLNQLKYISRRQSIKCKMCLVITWWQISLQTGSTTWASVWTGCTAKQQWLGQRKTIHPLFLNEHTYIWLLTKTLVMRTKKVCAGSMSRTKKKVHILYMLLNNLNKKDGLYSIPGEDEDWQEPWEWRRRRKSRNLQLAASPHKQFLPPGCRIHLPQLWAISSVEHYFPQFKSINKCKFVYIICTAD